MSLHVVGGEQGHAALGGDFFGKLHAGPERGLEPGAVRDGYCIVFLVFKLVKKRGQVLLVLALGELLFCKRHDGPTSP